MVSKKITPAEMLSFFKRVPMLAGLDETALTALVKVCSVKRVERGDVVFKRGDPAEALYIVWSGSIAEFAGGPNDVEVIVKVRRIKDYFGEIGILIDEPEMVTAVTIESGLLVVMPRSEFLMRVRSEPQLMQYLFKTLAQRLKLSGSRQIAHTLLDAPARLAHSALWLEEEEGGVGVITVSQEYLAQSCGLARQTVARILGDWRRSGWIVTRREKIEIIDRAALSDLVIKSIC